MSHSHIHDKLVQLLNENSIPFDLEPKNISQVINQIGDARIVLMGEASHGTPRVEQAPFLQGKFRSVKCWL